MHSSKRSIVPPVSFQDRAATKPGRSPEVGPRIVGSVAAAMILALAAPWGCFRRQPLPEGAVVALRRVADGFTSPVALAIPDDGTQRIFVVDQVGVIHIIGSDGEILPDPFLDVRDRMVDLSAVYDERGLLGLAFHPQYADNGRLFVVYNAPLSEDAPEGFDNEWRLSEFTVSADSADAADPDSERVLLRVDKPQFNHNGGQLAFGPDGLLYVSIGDGGGANDEGLGHTPETGNAQDRSNLLGKILRIDVDAEGENGYAIPANNPFVDEENARPEIWAFGLRNAWRFSFDLGSDHRLFAADAGQDLFEEVDIIVKGGNYGWRIREGFSCFNVDVPSSPLDECPDEGVGGEPLIDPIIELAHRNSAGLPVGTAAIGGYVYRGTALPELEGSYIFGDFSTANLLPDGQLYVAQEETDGSWTTLRLQIAGTTNNALGRYVLAFGQDEEGEVYVLTTRNVGPRGVTGEVYRLEAP